MSEINQYADKAGQTITTNTIEAIDLTGIAPHGARFTVVESEEEDADGNVIEHEYLIGVEGCQFGDELDSDVASADHVFISNGSVVVTLTEVEA